MEKRVVFFEENDWTPRGEEFQLVIERRKDDPKDFIVQVFALDGDTYEKVIVSITQDNNGNIRLGSNTLFKGKAVII